MGWRARNQGGLGVLSTGAWGGAQGEAEREEKVTSEKPSCLGLHEPGCGRRPGEHSAGAVKFTRGGVVCSVWCEDVSLEIRAGERCLTQD